ncbi:MAG TPA: hypothetical protein VFN13_05705 [Rudaea sp.]|nr:hypothetical protein [Rudaea sp.]
MKSYMASGTRTLLFAALAAASIGMANAGTLDVGQVSQSTAASNGTFNFAITNNGSTPSSDVRVFVGSQAAVSCANSTAQGNAFALQGTLDAGDSVQCSSSSTATMNRDLSITVLAKDHNGVPFTQTAHQIFSTAAVPNQAVVGILVGGVFVDTDSDQTFDAGETINFSYTVFNLGNVALAGLSVTDDLMTPISCPASSLTVGQSMVCNGTYTITAGDVGAGQVSNEGYVDGTSPVASSSDSIFRTGSSAAEIRALKSPLLSQDKDGNGVAGPGDVVAYTFAMKNSGSLPLNPVNMIEADPTRIDGTITCNSTTLGGSAFSGLGTGALPVGDTILCSAAHTITQADVTSGQAANLVNITGQTQFASASGSAASKFVVPPAPDSVSKAATPINDWRAMLLLGLGLLAAGALVTRRKQQGR